MLKQFVLGAALAIGAVSTAAFAAEAGDSGPVRYELRRISNGPRPSTDMLVAVHKPYALTGNVESRTARYQLRHVSNGPRPGTDMWVKVYEK